jgi:hypothetical protein
MAIFHTENKCYELGNILHILILNFLYTWMSYGGEDYPFFRAFHL